MTTCAHYRIRACEVCADCLPTAEVERAACLLTACRLLRWSATPACRLPRWSALPACCLPADC